MYINKKIQRMIIASVIAGGIFNLQLTNLSFIIPHSAFLIGNVAHAEIQTCTGTGDYIMPENGTPENAKEKAKLYAERNALEQAGIFISSQTVVKNAKLEQDEIQAFTAGILKVIDVKYKAIPLNEEGGYIKYTAIVTVQIDTTDLDNKINQWLSRNNQERVNQNNDLQRIIDEQARRIKELEQTIANAQTPQDTANINTEIQSIDKATLAAQRFEEGNKLYDNGDYNGAISKYTEAIQFKPDYDTAYVNRSYAYFTLQNYTQAIADCTKAIELNPNYGMAYNNRGIAYDELQNYEAAIADYTKAIELNPNFDMAYSNRGNSYYDLQQYNQAIDNYTKAIELNPNYAQAYANRGYTYFTLQNYTQAIADCTKAIELNPNYGMAYNNRGIAYIALQKYDEAIADFNKAIELNPNFDMAYVNRGNAYYYLQNYDTAISDYTRAISINPNYALAYNNRSVCYQAMGDNARAQTDFDKARELGYNG
ncbi:MAG: tetratricopeptide repeat protein [Selenomonadaceae bacterium]|nr:tetratricopeptide repeat protein [Selenomonadaceae bacterium]